MSQAVPLVDLAVGQRLRLVRVEGGQRLKRRLLALGLVVGGQVVEVLARGGNRVALGEGVAHKLYAEVLD